jgi:hypothetical protein
MVGICLGRAEVRSYLPDDSGKSEKETIAELPNILDRRELHRP